MDLAAVGDRLAEGDDPNDVKRVSPGTLPRCVGGRTRMQRRLKVASNVPVDTQPKRVTVDKIPPDVDSRKVALQSFWRCKRRCVEVMLGGNMGGMQRHAPACLTDAGMSAEVNFDEGLGACGKDFS